MGSCCYSKNLELREEVIEEKVLDNPHCPEEGPHLEDEVCVSSVLLCLYGYDSLHMKRHQLHLQGVSGDHSFE